MGNAGFYRPISWKFEHLVNKQNSLCYTATLLKQRPISFSLLSVFLFSQYGLNLFSPWQFEFFADYRFVCGTAVPTILQFGRPSKWPSLLQSWRLASFQQLLLVFLINSQTKDQTGGVLGAGCAKLMFCDSLAFLPHCLCFHRCFLSLLSTVSSLVANCEFEALSFSSVVKYLAQCSVCCSCIAFFLLSVN